jgi:hypothetical protein
VHLFRALTTVVICSCLSYTASPQTTSRNPASEATNLGTVIGQSVRRPEAPGWVDHVVTPGGAFALLVAEDALDRYFVQWVERRVGNRVACATLRVVFNPSRALANTAEMRLPPIRSARRCG